MVSTTFGSDSGAAPGQLRVRGQPGIIGRHLHMVVMWGLAGALGAFFSIGVFALIAMAIELMHQNDHACTYQRDDWRANERTGWFAAFMLGLTICFLFAGLPWAQFGWQVLGALVYVIGQICVSETWHRAVHKAARHRLSASRWRKTLCRVGIGLIIMFWGLRIVL